jgi:hypothetical protein
MAKSKSKVNLLQAFQAVSGALNQKRDDLNQKDTYNHDHGDNMVEIFDVITQAMKEKKNASPADQLAYASELLRKKQNSGSAQIYSQNLSQASQQLKDKPVNQSTIMQLIQALLGGSSQTSQQESNPLGSLAGALLGGSSSSQSQADPLASLAGALLGGSSQTSQQGTDPLSSLAGALLGGGSSSQSQTDSLSSLAASLLGGLTGSSQSSQSSQGSQGLMESIVGTLMSGSQMSGSDHRKESGQIVGSTLINTLLPMLLKK